ncbi:MAG: hypothetical protein MRJ96_11450 [Nitrospirales bacterium]|nr:hypothetical protein [Nitrospira sp.]MDR4502054.1 hypothetical protein [Nitrospirales bacterium]
MEAYGEFVLAFGVILFASNMQMALIVTPMMVNGPTLNSDRADNYYRSVFVLQVFVASFFFLVILTLGHLFHYFFFNQTVHKLYLPLAAATAGFLMQDFFRRYFFSLDKGKYAMWNDGLSYGGQIFGLLLMHMTMGLSVEDCLHIMAATSFLGVLHGMHKFQSGFQLLRLSLNDLLSIVSSHWSFGKWLLARNISYWSGTQAVIYLTAFFVSVVAVGAMSAARNIVGVCNILFLAIENFATPRATKIFASGGHLELNRYIFRLSILGGSMTGLLVITASLAPDFWLSLVYGSSYVGYGWVVIAWSLFYFLGFFQRPFGIALRVCRETRSIFIGTSIGTLVAILLSFPAMYYASLAGTMFVLIVTQLVITLSFVWAYQRIQITSASNG